jgi:uncharacterized protein
MYDDLARARYAQLRTYRRDGTPVDTPIWFVLDGSALLFRTKIGPKTARLTREPAVELRVCDYRGRVAPSARTHTGRASTLTGDAARRADRALHRRYGWQYNIVPLLRIPGVRNVHPGMPWREKLRRATTREIWPDSALVRVELD